MTDLFRRASELEARGEPHALATVVRVDRPVSARPGDRGLISTDGVLEGWIGGACSEPIVIREALSALADGASRLVRIRPPGAPREPDQPGVVSEVTACASEGGLDVFVEPRLPKPHLMIAGSAAPARALVKLARVLDYRVTAVLSGPEEQLPGADATIGLDAFAASRLGSDDAVVIATMNRYDEDALTAALHSDAGYIGLVASRARAQAMFEVLRGRDGIDLDRVRTPAGIDLGPSTQEEIALAVLAEVVAGRHRRRGERESEKVCPPEASQREAVDPICGMTVAITTATVSAAYGDTTVYFCSPHCRAEFSRDPARYRNAAGT
jgi:xanthine dehydrogenase accessory factor